MSAQSPRPISHRVFTVLLAVLLVGSIAGPAMVAQPAQAQTSTDSCLTSSTYLLTSCAAGDIQTTTYDGDPAATQTTLHSMSVSQWESEKAIQTILENYGEDTTSIASLEARNAIATAYEQGNTAAEADQMARDAIRDYYAQRQINTIETMSKAQAQFAHVGNITNEPDIDKGFIYQPVNSASVNADVAVNGIQEDHLTGEMVTHTTTLVNGTSYDYEMAEYAFEAEYGTYFYSPGLEDVVTAQNEVVVDDSDDYFRIEGEDSGSSLHEVRTGAQVNVRNSYIGTSNDLASGLPGQMVHDYVAWKETNTQWSDQSATMTSNYVDIASDLYAEMDAGNLDPNELRGAEGMVRYLSGDGNATEGDYRTALQYTLDTSNPNLTETSTMRVHIDGYTGLEWDESTDTTSREPTPTNSINTTKEGLLFASGVSSITAGETYSTTATDSKSFYLIDENGTETTLVEGDITIEAIYDSSGDEVDSASYSEPEYSSYNATEFINYLEENEEVRNAIVSDDSSSGVSVGDLFGGNPAIGMALVAAIVVLFGLAKIS